MPWSEEEEEDDEIGSGTHTQTKGNVDGLKRLSVVVNFNLDTHTPTRPPAHIREGAQRLIYGRNEWESRHAQTGGRGSWGARRPAPVEWRQEQCIPVVVPYYKSILTFVRQMENIVQKMCTVHLQIELTAGTRASARAWPTKQLNSQHTNIFTFICL